MINGNSDPAKAPLADFRGLDNHVNTEGSSHPHDSNTSLPGTNMSLPLSLFEMSTKSCDPNSSTTFEVFQNPIIIGHLSLFFKWQYQDNVFIHRESFLTDFFKEQADLKTSLSYCNVELIFAICALGLHANSPPFEYDGTTFSTPETYCAYSKNKLLSNIGQESFNDIPSVQALLCLAHFDLGRGNNLSAWSLSGLAFRIGQHMGFEHNSAKGILSEYDTRVQSRVYWGCYLADHKISLILGRQSMLHLSEATIEESEDLPIVAGIEQFMYVDPSNEKDPNFKIALHLKHLVELYKIAGENQASLFKRRKNNKSATISDDIILQLGNFNLDIMNWKLSLDELSWTKVELKSKGFNPNVMSIRFQYHFVILCFNRPFLNGGAYSQNLSSGLICAEVIEELYYSLQSFRSHYTFEHASLTMVFNAILAISALLSLPQDTQLILSKSTLFKYFFRVLRECSGTWTIAGSFCESIHLTMEDTSRIPSPEQIRDLIPDFDKFIEEDLQFLVPGQFGF